MAETELVGRAESVVESLLSALGRRWGHVQGVAARAGELTPDLDPDDQDLVVAAAWLHDVGYAPELVQTGFHPVDGARFLAGEGLPEVVVALVAHHTGAVVESVERGLAAELAEFPEPPAVLLDRLMAADMTVGPDGSRVSPSVRVAEILSRYGPGEPVHRAISRSGPVLDWWRWLSVSRPRCLSGWRLSRDRGCRGRGRGRG